MTAAMYRFYNPYLFWPTIPWDIHYPIPRWGSWTWQLAWVTSFVNDGLKISTPVSLSHLSFMYESSIFLHILANACQSTYILVKTKYLGSPSQKPVMTSFLWIYTSLYLQKQLILFLEQFNLYLGRQKYHYL